MAVIQYPAGVGGRTTRVLEAGLDGEAVVFCHGLAARADRWRRNLEPVAAVGYHAYAYDHPGHGLADKGPDADYTVPGFADFLEGFLDTMGVESAYLVGTSFGGATAATFAIRHPDRVKGLVLIGAVGLAPIPEATRRNIQARVGDASIDGARKKLSTLLIDSNLVTEEFVLEESRINSSPGAAAAFERLGDYMGDRVEDDITVDGLAKLSGELPILLLWGELDRTFPVSVAESAHSQIADSQLVLIRNAGHAPYYERADAFNGVLLDFLSGQVGTFEHAAVEYR